MEVNVPDLYDFIGKLLDPKDFKNFRDELNQYLVEIDRNRAKLKANESEQRKKVNSSPLKTTPCKNKINEIVSSAIKKAAREKVEKAWKDKIQEPIALAYAYKLTDYEIGLNLSRHLEFIEFLRNCCHKEFPSSRVFIPMPASSPKTIIINGPTKGYEPETKTPYESIGGSINGVKFHIFMIEYLSDRPSDSSKHVASGNEPFSLKNHPFPELKKDGIRRVVVSKEESGGCFWIILICVVFGLGAMFLGKI